MKNLLIYSIFLFIQPLCLASNIIEERVDENGIYIKASNGREFSLTKEQIRVRVINDGQSTGKDIITGDMIRALGADMIDPADLAYTLDDVKSEIKDLKVDTTFRPGRTAIVVDPKPVP